MHASFSSQPDKISELEIKSILLLDDDEELAATLKALIESRNFVFTEESLSALSAAGFPLKDSRSFVVTTVGNGAEGLREVMDFDFDVIICDMVMPTVPGDMFYLAVKKTKPHLCDRFIFITGHRDNPRVDAFLKKTNGLVLIKPVLTAELVPMISQVLQHSDAVAQRGAPVQR